MNPRLRTVGLALIPAAAAILTASVIFFVDPQSSSQNTSLKELKITRADTKQERYRGLSGRESLPADQGLLLVYDTSKRHGIVMRDMNFPIDIIWLDARGSIVDIKRGAKPNSYQSRTNHTVFKPQKPARYVLEVNAGVAERRNYDGDTNLSKYLPQR